MLKPKVRKEERGKFCKIINNATHTIKGLPLTLYITTVGSLVFPQNISEPFPKNHLISCTKTNEVSFLFFLLYFPLDEANSAEMRQVAS